MARGHAHRLVAAGEGAVRLDHGDVLLAEQEHAASVAAAMRVAAIDQGTNTTRLLVADVDDGRVEDVVARQEITRLGEGVDSRRRLLPLPIARVRNVLTDYRREAERLGAERTLLVATSAVRDAENGEAFLGEIEWSYGFTTQLLGGEDEAELTFEASRATGGSSARRSSSTSAAAPPSSSSPVRTVSTRGRASTSAPSG